jgi:hypothetical protein
MSKHSSSGGDKKERVIEIKTMLNSFCETYLNEALEGYTIRLCNELSRKRKINILRGKKEIWAASIIYVISRLNFLFDKENENYITVDIISNFFNTNKSTICNKATQIERICKLTIGAEGYRSKEITDSFTFYQTPEGFIIPKSMIGDREIIIESAECEEAEEIERFAENQRSIMKQKAKEKKERRTEINRQIAEKKKTKKRNKNQLSLFDDL